MESIRVVAAVIERDGRFLITQRRPEAVLPLLWEFPGGKVEPGEADQAALRRELKERLAADVDVGEELSSILHDYEGYTVTLIIFKAELHTDQLSCARVNDFRWVTSKEFDQYEFPPADQSTMDQLLGISPG